MTRALAQFQQGVISDELLQSDALAVNVLFAALDNQPVFKWSDYQLLLAIEKEHQCLSPTKTERLEQDSAYVFLRETSRDYHPFLSQLSSAVTRILRYISPALKEQFFICHSLMRRIKEKMSGIDNLLQKEILQLFFNTLFESDPESMQPTIKIHAVANKLFAVQRPPCKEPDFRICMMDALLELSADDLHGVP